MDAVDGISIAALVSVIVALAKGLYGGEMPPRLVLGTVLAASGALVVLSVTSGSLTGTPLDLIATWLYTAAGAVGIRSGVAAIPGVGSALTSLPSRS